MGSRNSLKYTRRVFDAFRGNELPNFELATLAELCGLSTEGAHQANRDVEMLQGVYEQASTYDPDIELRAYTYPPQATRDKIRRKDAKKANMPSFAGHALLSKQKTAQAAASGLRYEHLVAVFKNEGQEGIKALFSEKDKNGKPRVSASTRVIKPAVTYLKSH